MFNFDRRTIYIVVAAVLVLGLFSMGTEGIMGMLMSLPGVIIAITFHEFAHAWTAYKLGDNTPMYQGRLNLNPLSHIDPIGLVMLIVAHFGWGKPVQINPNNFNGKYSLSASEAIVSVAGPLANFIVAILFAIIYALLIKFQVVNDTINVLIQYIIILNIGLGVFNLIPIPPLDGSKILMHFLPYNAKVWFESKQYIFYIVFLLLFVTGIAGNIVAPVNYFLYEQLMNLVGLLIYF